MGDVVVNIRGKLDPSVARAMRGVSDAQRKADREANESRKRLAAEQKKRDQEALRNARKLEQERAKAARQGDRDAAAAARQTARERAKAEQEAVRAVRRAEAEKRKEIERTNREAARSAQQRASVEAREARAVERINQRVFADRLRVGRATQARNARAVDRMNAANARDRGAALDAGMTMIGGAVVGTLSATAAYAQQRQTQLQGWLGAQDSDSVLAMAGDLQLTLTRLATQGGRAKSELDAFVTGMADFGATTDESTQMLADAQNNFTAQVGNIIANRGVIGRSALAFGAAPSDVMKVGALGVRDMGVSQADYDEAIAIAMASTDKGNVEAAELASKFQGGILMAHSVFGSTGTEGMRQWAVGAQLAPNSGYDTSGEQAHSYENFMQRLAMPSVREDLAKAGVSVTTGANGTGAMRSELDVLRAFASSSLDLGQLNDILGDINASRYALGVQSAGNGRITELYNSSNAANGARITDEAYGNLMGTQAGRNYVEQAQRQNTIFQQSEDAYRTARRETGAQQDYAARNAAANPWKTRAMTTAASVMPYLGQGIDMLSGIFGTNDHYYEKTMRQGARDMLKGDGRSGRSTGPQDVRGTVSLSAESIAAINRQAPQDAGEGSGGRRGASPAERRR